MSLLLLILAAIVLVAFLANVVFLWLTCKLFRVRYPADGTQPEAGVSMRRAFLLALLIFGLDLVSVVAAALAGIASPWLSLGVALLSLVVPLVVLRLTLPVGILRAVGINIVWGLLGVVSSVVIVFAIRTFFVEAVVMPTGGMAETVYGYQKQVTCPACGLEFPVNCSLEVDPGEGPPTFVSGCTCPNCRMKIRLQRPGHPKDLAPGQIADPGWNEGDRFLFGKGLLGANIVVPQRFDPVVFDRLPSRPKAEGDAAKPIRYFQRLVGLPGEMLAIHRGDLFVLDAEQVPAKVTPDDGRDLAGFAPDEQAVELFRQGKFRILRKPPALVLALMRLVYDSGHPARDLTQADQRRWVGDGGWTEQGGRFRHDGDDTGWLRYRHVLRDAEKPQLISDFSGYNSWEPRVAPMQNWASDLILECEVDAGSSGELTLELSRGPDRFSATFDLAKQTCALTRVSGDNAGETLKETAIALPSTGARLRFANVDERLIVWVGDKLVFGDGVEYVGPKTLIAEPKNDLDRPASVGIKGAAVTVHRLRLLRDTYYTTARGGSPSTADVPELHLANPQSFRHLADAPVSAYRIEPGHYFVLGDNSPESADSRLWGLVAKKQMLGKALWRYYPFLRWGRME